MKTLHRLMYENLTPEEYKEFCKCKIEKWAIPMDHSISKASLVLDNCLEWWKQPQEDGYWNEVYSRLRKLNK